MPWFFFNFWLKRTPQNTLALRLKATDNRLLILRKDDRIFIGFSGITCTRAGPARLTELGD